MIVNFLIALIDESNRIAKSIKKDPDFLEFIIFSLKVKLYVANTQLETGKQVYLF